MAERKVPLSTDWGANMVRTEAWTDDNRILVESSQDCSAIAKANKIIRNETDVKFNSKYDRTGRWHFAARIPNIIVDQLMREKSPAGIMKWHDKKYMKAWLNNPANKTWRTGGGWV